MNFEELVEIVAKLRAPGGCPWDREQTRETLKPFLIEEFYELIDAIDEDSPENMKEELGDLLFQIVIQSQLSSEEGKFSIHDVVDGIARKMVRRHPHVFGEKKLKTSSAVEDWWEENKKAEGKNHGSLIDGVPRSMPSLLRSQELQLKATSAGFDWERVEDAIAKLEEEVQEFKEALRTKDKNEIENELGDMLFVLVRISNFLGVNPEDALTGTINKFIRRFHFMESRASDQGRKLTDMTLADMDELWNEAKKSV